MHVPSNECRTPTTVAGSLQAAAARNLKHFVTTAIMRCSYNMRGSEMYTAHATMSVVDETLDLIAHFIRGPVVTMNRNTVDKSGATGVTLGAPLAAFIDQTSKTVCWPIQLAKPPLSPEQLSHPCSGHARIHPPVRVSLVNFCAVLMTRYCNAMVLCTIVKKCRPDFLCWVNNALLFKGEEKADISDLQSAVAELSKKMSDAWVKDLLPNHRMPCMLGLQQPACCCRSVVNTAVVRVGTLLTPLICWGLQPHVFGCGLLLHHAACNADAGSTHIPTHPFLFYPSLAYVTLLGLLVVILWASSSSLSKQCKHFRTYSIFRLLLTHKEQHCPAYYSTVA